MFDPFLRSIIYPSPFSWCATILFSSTFLRGYIISTCGLWYKYRIVWSNAFQHGKDGTALYLESFITAWIMSCLLHTAMCCNAPVHLLYFRCISFRLFLIRLQTWIELHIVNIRIYCLMKKDLIRTLLFHFYQNNHSIYFVKYD